MVQKLRGMPVRAQRYASASSSARPRVVIDGANLVRAHASFCRQSAFGVGGNHIKHDSGSVYADEAHARGGAFAARMLSRGDALSRGVVQLTCTNS